MERQRISLTARSDEVIDASGKGSKAAMERSKDKRSGKPQGGDRGRVEKKPASDQKFQYNPFADLMRRG
jgi:hypothetical protein